MSTSTPAIASADSYLADQSLVLKTIQDRVAWLTLNRPEKRNALSAAMVSALKEAISNAELDEGVRIIVLAANGKVFCSGADLDALQQMQQNTYEQNLADSEHLRGLFAAIVACPKPVIACVQGSALAGGCGLVNVCDFAFSAPEAQFGYTEVRIGFVPALVSAYLVKRIGEGAARGLLLSADLISAAQAHSLGMITELVPADELTNYVHAFATRLATQNSGEAMARTKALLLSMDGLPVVEATALAAVANAEARASDDCKKGVGAFLRKEKVVW